LSCKQQIQITVPSLLSAHAHIFLSLVVFLMQLLLLMLMMLLLLCSVIRKDLVLVEGAIGSCNTLVTPGQLLQQLQPVAKKGPRVVSLEVRRCNTLMPFGLPGGAESYWLATRCQPRGDVLQHT
jgi:hypothetical protein